MLCFFFAIGDFSEIVGKNSVKIIALENFRIDFRNDRSDMLIGLPRRNDLKIKIISLIVRQAKSANGKIGKERKATKSTRKLNTLKNVAVMYISKSSGLKMV